MLLSFISQPLFEQYVREIWKGLHDEGITSNMFELKTIDRMFQGPSIRIFLTRIH